MYTTDARKLSLIDRVLKIKNEALLAKIERLLNSSKNEADASAAVLQDFAGFLSEKEASAMKEAISMTCETIDEDVWK